MCGRYALYSRPEAIRRHFRLSFLPVGLRPRYNIAPSQQGPIVRASPEGGRELVLMRWGLVPRWSKEPKVSYSTINAMAETVHLKPAYRAAFRRRRCLVPASGWYEWEETPPGRRPWFFKPKAGDLLAFAGIWERWGEGEEAFDSYSVIVTEANELAKPIHQRMPVVLSPEDYDFWLDPAVTEPEALRPLLAPCPSEWLEAHPVSARVNSPQNDEPALIAPALP